MVTFLGQAETKAIAFWSPEHQYVFWRSHLHPLCVSSCLLLLYESWILVIFALICFQKHYFYLLFYVFGLPFSMAPPRRDSLHHIFLLPCRNSAEAFHPATVQVISYENHETLPIWILTQFVKPTLDTSNLFLSSVPRIMIAKAATNSWKLSLPSPEESNLGEIDIHLTPFSFTWHAENPQLETHETCVPPRTGRLTTFQIRWSEFGCCMMLQANAALMQGMHWGSSGT